MDSIGDKIVYPAYNKYGYMQDENYDTVTGITYKEALILALAGNAGVQKETTDPAGYIVNLANKIIGKLDSEK